jgi:hypothetical protein
VRKPLVRLIGLAAAGSLILGPLAAASPANAIDPGNGIISVAIVDDLGRPVVGMVQLIPADPSDDPVILGLPDSPDARPVVTSSYSEQVPAGTYGALIIGGWAGVTCIGLSTCSFTALEGGVPSVGAGAFTIAEGAAKPLTVTVATPKLTGSPGIGLPLTAAVPSSLRELGSVFGGVLGLGMATDPVVAWNRNGAPFGASGTTYVPTAADAGSTISATITFPAILSLLFTTLAPGAVPPAFTTSAVSIDKLNPSITLSVPGKIKPGKRPTAYVNVKVGSTLVGGTVTFTVDKLRPQQGVLRSGLATFKLPKLKPGKHKVTATFAAVGAYNAAKSTKTVVVKGKKAKKPKKGKGKKH